MCGKGMHGGGVHGRGMHSRGHAWQGPVWQEGMHGRGHVWQGMHGGGGGVGMCGRRDNHCSGRYASYWNAFLFIDLFASFFEEEVVAKLVLQSFNLINLFRKLCIDQVISNSSALRVEETIWRFSV